MSVADDLARGWRLPADAVPFSGRQLDILRRDESFAEVIANAKVVRVGPAWTSGRLADAWLISADRQTACPLLWNEQGELEATIVLRREHVDAEAPADRWLDDLTWEREPLAGRHVQLSPHAHQRFAERVPDGDLDALLADAAVSLTRPDFARSPSAAAWLHLSDDIALPVVRGLHGTGPVALTVLTRGEAECRAS